MGLACCAGADATGERAVCERKKGLLVVPLDVLALLQVGFISRESEQKIQWTLVVLISIGGGICNALSPANVSAALPQAMHPP